MRNRIESTHFNFLWEEVISPSIELCKREIHENFRSYVRCNDVNKYKNAIESLYREKREWLKELYLHNKVAKQEDEANLDMHKIAAILTRSVIGCKYFIFDQKKAIKIASALPKEQQLSWLKDNAYVNYKLAYMVGLKTVYIDLLCSHLVKQENGYEVAPDREKELQYIISNGGLYKYSPNINHGDFDTSMIVMFMKNDVNDRDFDYLGLATIFFQLEEVTKLNAKYKVGVEQKEIALKEAEEEHSITIKSIKEECAIELKKMQGKQKRVIVVSDIQPVPAGVKLSESRRAGQKVSMRRGISKPLKSKK